MSKLVWINNDTKSVLIYTDKEETRLACLFKKSGKIYCTCSYLSYKETVISTCLDEAKDIIISDLNVYFKEESQKAVRASNNFSAATDFFDKNKCKLPSLNVIKVKLSSNSTKRSFKK